MKSYILTSPDRRAHQCTAPQFGFQSKSRHPFYWGIKAFKS